ncbi:TIM-barrel domain-containing protein [Flavobacterium sp. TMP13]|uniref:glycoside hydrolase family 31 protein n=1 Tax=Flavobacterium sp. TMP13 TaxID=3425950 RepID=UPI003D77D4E8
MITIYKRKVLFASFALLLVFFSCSKITTYKKNGNYVTYPTANGQLQIVVCNENIMQVKYTLADKFDTKKSLILDDNAFTPTAFDVTETSDEITIATKKIKAKINKATAAVSFFDENNKAILKEVATGGKKIEPNSFEGFQTHSVSQKFESPDNEALYGLGQHQDRLLNLKGRDLDLYQHNTEVYMPFFMSTSGYGLLWNNYAHTKFGDPDEIKAIPANNLLASDQKEGGLDVVFYSDNAFKEKINTEDSKTNTLAIKKENPVQSARYSGYLVAEKSGEHAFYSYADGTFRLKVNGSLVLDNWAPYANARDMGLIQLEKGKKYKIEIEWERFHKNNSFQLKWREPHPTSETSLWSASGNEINYFVIAGKSMDTLISGYRTLTGKATLLPKWAMGLWQSKERYKTQDEVLNVVREYRKRQVPLDIIVQDWQYWKTHQWGSATFEPARFPNPTAMIDTLHKELNTKFIISVWGKFYRDSDNFRELHKAGFLYPKPLEEGLVDFLQFNFSYYDAFNPEARKMYWKQLNEKLYAKGVDGWWMDAAEPEMPDHDATPDNMAHFMNPTYEGPGFANLNAFPLQHSKGVFEGQMEVDPDKRLAILTRSSFAGQQKYSTIVWSGDIAGEWNNLKASIPAGLSFSMSGIPYWTTDTGGFWVKYKGGNQNPEYRELFTRWYQFSAFCPIFRVHGSDTPREIWFFGDEKSDTYQTQLKFNKLRYRLMPYIYTLNGMLNTHDYTMMRALVMDFANDTKVHDIKDQYMFGPSFMACPVTDYKATKRDVYLPKETKWVDFWTGKTFDGGQTISTVAPLNEMPLYLKAGSIVPFGPDVQYALEKPADTIELRVYTGADGSFSLYEDENTNNNYLKGKSSSIPFQWNETTQTLTIAKRIGSFDGMLKQRTFNIVFVNETNGKGSLVSSKIDKKVTYLGEEIQIKK